jgi:hypothetical protein
VARDRLLSYRRLSQSGRVPLLVSVFALQPIVPGPDDLGALATDPGSVRESNYFWYKNFNFCSLQLNL